MNVKGFVVVGFIGMAAMVPAAIAVATNGPAAIIGADRHGFGE